MTNVSEYGDDATVAGLGGNDVIAMRVDAAPASLLSDGGYKEIREGTAIIHFPNTNEAPPIASVFYNPVQEFNRDISIAAIRTWHALRSRMAVQDKKNKLATKDKKDAADAAVLGNDVDDVGQDSVASTTATPETPEYKFTILEALSATGLRSIRYIKEIPHIRSITANDLLLDAVTAIKRNLAHNSVSEDLVNVTHRDACSLMYECRDSMSRVEKFDVVDLDPYGSASIFIDPAVQAVKSGGLLCVTCTDLMVLAGNNYPENCFAKYGGVGVRAEYCHELALRLVIRAIQTSAIRYRRHVQPLLSLSIDFYVRIFLRVTDEPAKAKSSFPNTSLVYNCTGCAAFALQPMGRNRDGGNFSVAQGPTVDSTCGECGSKYHVGGPFYAGPLHDRAFLATMIQHVKDTERLSSSGGEVGSAGYGTKARMVGMLTVASEESDAPLYYTLPKMCKAVHLSVPPAMKIMSALIHQGYEATSSHACMHAIKTNAPASVMWDIIRSWVRDNPVRTPVAGSVAANILAKEPKVAANFAHHPKAMPESRKIKLVRYQENPTENWGPKARAKKQKTEHKVE